MMAADNPIGAGVGLAAMIAGLFAYRLLPPAAAKP
jgi:hypothetical protein